MNKFLKISLKYAQIIVANIIVNISFLSWLHLKFLFARMPDTSTNILGVLSYSIYVNASGKENTECGSIATPCRSLSLSINVCSHNDTIFLIASPIKQIRYTLENTIVIKHSLTITTFSMYGQNPVMTYHLNVTSNWKEICAFAISRYVLPPEILTLNIKSVNFNVNILLTTSSKGFKTLQKNVVDQDKFGFPLSLSIVDSIISSPCHAINLTLFVMGYFWPSQSWRGGGRIDKW